MTPKWLPGHGALIPAHAVLSVHGHRHTQVPWLSGPGPGLCAHSICTTKDWRPQEARGILGKISCPLVFTELWWEAGRTQTMSSSPDGPEMPPCWHRQACAWYLAHAHKGTELPKPPEAPRKPLVVARPWDTLAISTVRAGPQQSPLPGVPTVDPSSPPSCSM